MIRRTTLRALSSAVLLALLVTAIHPMPAFAEEGTLPDPAPTESSGDAASADEIQAKSLPSDGDNPRVDPASEATPTAEPAPDDPAAGAAPPADASTEAVLQQDAAEAADPALDATEGAATDAVEILAALPDGTTVAVVDAAGEPVPLVSEEAQAIVAGGDPVWCPAALKAPTPGLNGCSGSFFNLYLLINFLNDNINEGTSQYQADGVIWIEAGADTSALPMAMDGALPGDNGFEFMSNYKLTLRGGWNGVSGSKVTTPLTFAADGTPSGGTWFTRPLLITNWKADVTISDILIHDVAVGAYALQVTQVADSPGSITLTRVAARNNTPQGAQLLNNAGTSTGKVTITDSQFTGNGSYGLEVRSRGAITLASLIASGNQYGAYLVNAHAGATGGITLTGASTFEDNERDGLIAASNGAITANDLTARNNGLIDSLGSGVTLDNDSSLAHAAVKLTGLNIFTGNHNTGLVVHSYGPVTLNSVNANANLNSGGVIITTDTATTQPVTLTGTNSMRYNGNHGLSIDAYGKITVNSLTANGNAGSGAWLTNEHGASTGDVVLTGANAFHDNGGTGLYVRTSGAISAANLSADRNGNQGASLLNDGTVLNRPITLTGVNAFHDNWADNLHIQSDGAVTLSNVTASGSTTMNGAYIMNTGASTAQKVALSGTNIFEGNFQTGLYIVSNGAASVSNLRATENGLVGLNGYGASINNLGAPTPQSVTFSTSALASGNYGDGLYVQSLGNITAASLTAGGSVNGAGANLDNRTGTGGVTLTGTNVFTANYSNNLQISSAGLVKLNSLTASGSLHGVGASMNNSWSADAAPKDVLLTGALTFNGNCYHGLYVTTKGAVTLSSTAASGNGTSAAYGDGISIDNSPGTLPKPVTLSGSYTLNDNLDYGLRIRSGGAIKVNNLTASGNDERGATLDNSSDAEALGGVTLTGTNVFNDNGGDRGLMIVSEGAVAAANLTATGNNGTGVHIRNTYGLATVKLTGTNVFTGNRGFGLAIYSMRAITVSNLTASGTIDGRGASLDNDEVDASGGVTLSGTNLFEDNEWEGLVVESDGAITVNSITAIGNGIDGSYYGVNLVNYSAGTPQAVKLTGTNVFNENHRDGLRVYTQGAITASSISASGNLGAGARLTNDDGTAGVTLSGTSLYEDNNFAGLVVSTQGAITLNAVTANGNGLAGSYSGAELYNAGSSAFQPVKLTGVNVFNDNPFRGLDIQSQGAITISSLTASGNTGSYGAYLVNNVGSATGGVTLSGTNALHDNGSAGLFVATFGAITLNSVSANGNAMGARVYNDGSLAAAPPAIKLTGTNSFNDNDTYGLDARSRGAITINNLSASRNAGGDGAYLVNDSGAAGVTLTGTNLFDDNADDGLEIASHGVATLSGVTADNNADRGLSLSAFSATLTCANLTSNGAEGLYASVTDLLKLIGVFSLGNGLDDDLAYGTLSITRACP